MIAPAYLDPEEALSLKIISSYAMRKERGEGIQGVLHLAR
jgi:hypothetical protein